MKKILAFVLALVMVLGMATVVSAATSLSNGTMVNPDAANATTATVTVVDWDEGDTTAKLKLTIDGTFTKVIAVTDDYDTTTAQKGIGDIKADGYFTVTTTEDTTKLFISVYVSEHPYYIAGAASDIDKNAESSVGKTVESANGVADDYTLVAGDKFWLEGDSANPKDTLLYNVTLTREESTDIVIHSEVYNAVYRAYEGKADTIVIDLQETDEYITAEEWQFMTHGIVNSVKGDVTLVDEDGEPYTDNGWWKSFGYLNMDIKLTDGTTIFYIDAADIDYTWDEDVDFAIDDGLTYTGLTKAEVYAAIRKLTGDTKNPYTFGFVTPSKVPTMTISYVIPQQWINVYGHKDLAIWAYTQENVKCEACGQKHDEFKTIEGTTLDAITQTQRIEFETNEFYSTIVLSKTAASTATDTAKTDENPNTGANDIVNVAIVFSVISLAAAGAFVFSKQR